MRGLWSAPPAFRRNVPLLAVGWIMATMVTMTAVSVTALTGHMLAEDKSLAALPIMLQWFGTATTTFPASFFMQRFGRRKGFMVGAALIALGAVVAVYAIFQRDFLIYCLGMPLIGGGVGFNWYYRFAAADVSTEEYRSRAISLVLAGGIVSAILAPTLAVHTKDLFAPVIYAGCFASIAVFAMVAFAVVSFVDIPRPPPEHLHGGRPIREIARQPAYRVAVLGGIVSYSVMILMMSVSPLAMTDCGLGFGDVAVVIQSHMLGMYLPSFFTGHLIRKFGIFRMMQVGIGLIAACILVSVSGVTLTHFWLSMAFLGVGWNFLFVGATTLLTTTYTSAERAKAQGVNELLIFGVTGLATFLSGTLLHDMGWAAVGMAALPPVVLVFVATLWLANRRRRVLA
jgi:MFS family permease